MANPKFFWDTDKSLSFPLPLSGLDRRNRAERDLAFAASGAAGAVFEHALDEVMIEVEAFAERDFYRALRAWWAWAARGLPYGFALDGDDAVDAALDGPAAAGQKVVPLASTAGISEGGFYILRSADGTKMETVEVDAIDAGVSITAAANLVYAYAAGDSLRSEGYWPRAVSLDDKFPAREKDYGIFEFKHKFKEIQ